MATVSTVKNITIAYNPNDFFYVTALNSSGNIFNSDNTNCNDIVDITTYNRTYCSPLIDSNITNCYTLNANDANIKNCYDNELCINKFNANKINQLQSNHDGSSERRNDKNVDYNRELLRSYNLGIGIVGVGAMFYFFYK